MVTNSALRRCRTSPARTTPCLTSPTTASCAPILPFLACGFISTHQVGGVTGAASLQVSLMDEAGNTKDDLRLPNDDELTKQVRSLCQL